MVWPALLFLITLIIGNDHGLADSSIIFWFNQVLILSSKPALCTGFNTRTDARCGVWGPFAGSSITRALTNGTEGMLPAL